MWAGTIREHSELSVFSCLADARREVILEVSQEVRGNLLILNGGQRRDRTADAGSFQGRLASALSSLESADIIETNSFVASSI